MLRCAWLTCIPLHSSPFHAEHCNLVGAEGRLSCSDMPLQEKNNQPLETKQQPKPTNKQNLKPNSPPDTLWCFSVLKKKKKSYLLCVARGVEEYTLPLCQSVGSTAQAEPVQECQYMPTLDDQALFCQTPVQLLCEQFPAIPSQGSLSHALLHNAGWPTCSRFCSHAALLLQQVRHKAAR